MKRSLCLAVILLLLCGCADQPPEETTATVPTQTITTPPETTEPAGIYVPHSDLEIQTDGAVRYYVPAMADCYGMLTMGEDILVFSGAEKTTLSRLSGEDLYTLASRELSCRVEPEDASFQISQNGITYYDRENRTLIFLDKELKEVSRLDMSSGMVGIPVLSSNRMQVYYCTADAVRVYDMGTGLDKLLKAISYPSQSVEGIGLNDKILRCSLTDAQGLEYTIFISTDTGEMVANIQQDLELTTRGDRYYALLRDEVMDLLLFGNAEDEPMVVHPRHMDCDSWYLPDRDLLVTAFSGETVWVDCYDLLTGKRIYGLELPESVQPASVVSECGGGIYILGYDRMAGQNVICLWDPEMSLAEDDTVYTSRRYTAEDPDTRGLADCAKYAEAISRTYGITVLTGAEAIAVQPWDYTLEQEYRVSVLKRQLQHLEGLLAQLPEGFLEKLPEEVQLCLVRSITGNAVSGSLDQAQGLQFWENKKVYVVIASGEGMDHTLFHELFHVMDSKILSDSNAYYHWHQDNPEDFQYFEDYTTWQTVEDSPWLRGEGRAFIDAYSMSYPREDRARIMEYACTQGNEAYFASEIMQAKLRTLCQGIREAFGLENASGSLLWEQYLLEPLNK